MTETATVQSTTDRIAELQARYDVCTFNRPEGDACAWMREEIAYLEDAATTIQAPRDNDGTLQDTGYHVGERVLAEFGGETFLRVVLGPARRCYDVMSWHGSEWGRRTESMAALRVAPEGHPDLWVDVPLARLERMTEAVR